MIITILNPKNYIKATRIIYIPLYKILGDENKSIVTEMTHCLPVDKMRVQGVAGRRC